MLLLPEGAWAGALQPSCLQFENETWQIDSGQGQNQSTFMCQLCSCPRPQPTLGYINTHPRMHLCSNVRVHAQVARAHTPNNCAPCCEPSWLNSFRKFCQFGLSKCCCRKHERGITSCLAVNVTELYTNTRTHTHIGMQQHSKAHTQL